MWKERGRPAEVRGILTALLVVAGMLVVATVTVVWSTSQQFPTPQPQASGSATSGSVALQNQSTGGQQGGAPSPETSYVKILLGSADSVSYSFSPVQVTVVIGVNNTVTWVNNDNAAHTVTASDGSFDSGNIGAGGIYTHTFTTPGAYRYFCAYHAWMVGTVVVEA